MIRCEIEQLKKTGALSSFQHFGLGNRWTRETKDRFYISDAIISSLYLHNDFSHNFSSSQLYYNIETGEYGSSTDLTECELRKFEAIFVESMKWLKENFNKKVLSPRTGQIQEIKTVIHFFK